MEVKAYLKQYFGYDEFRPGQEQLITGLIAGRDALGIMPTGGGKSLCYQLPAIVLEGLTFVISPLISLMKDQVDALLEMGISAVSLNSTLLQDEFMERLKAIREGKYKLVFVAPERLNTSLFTELTRRVKVSLVAIDEAHCISQWGHDFRPSYLEIPRFISSLKGRPVVAAFTATATKEIVTQIKELIGLENPIEVTTGFDRPNLYYQVVKEGNKLRYLIQYLQDNFQRESGIIYCATRKTVESLVKNLQDRGFSVAGYHGGMEAEERQQNQDDFMFNRVRLIVATNAFGMGIDKPDVRFVIHYNMPKNMEAYYQEAGRGGRDGEPSHCILMYSPADVVKQKLIMESEVRDLEREALQYKNLQYLIDFCHTSDCLRNKIISYFGEEITRTHCNHCSNCLDRSELVDITVEAQKILSCIFRVQQRYGVNVVVQVLRGSKSKKLQELGLDQVSTYGMMKNYDENTLREMIMTLAASGYIHITTDKYPVLKLTAKCRQVLQGQEQVYYKKSLLEKNLARTSRRGKVAGELPVDEGLLGQLKALRYTLAQEKNLPAYMIFSDKTLKEMAAAAPQDQEAFLQISGVGAKKYESYGHKFIRLIREYTSE